MTCRTFAVLKRAVDVGFLELFFQLLMATPADILPSPEDFFLAAVGVVTISAYSILYGSVYV
jgi:hypothetical protein